MRRLLWRRVYLAKLPVEPIVCTSVGHRIAAAIAGTLLGAIIQPPATLAQAPTAQQPAAEQRVAALKQSMLASQQSLRKYE